MNSNTQIDKIIKIQSLIRMRYCIIMLYINYIEPLIKKLYQRENKEYVHEPTIFGYNSEENKKMSEIAFIQKQKEMKEGELAQIIIGNWFDWEDLGVGHLSGLDCRKKDKPIIMEVKNKWNTCNSGSQKTVLDKLSKYKKENPETRCVWAIINPDPNVSNTKELSKDELIELCKQNNLKYSKSYNKNKLKEILKEKAGMKDSELVKSINNNYEKIIHNGVEIEKIQGIELFKLVFKIGKIDYSSQVIKSVQYIVNKYR